MPHIPQFIIPEVQSRSLDFLLSAEYQRRRLPMCFYCSFVKKVLKLLTTGSEDCYYIGTVNKEKIDNMLTSVRDRCFPLTLEEL